MANASAKRSAAARQATESFYRPFLLLINGTYLALVYYLKFYSSTSATTTATSSISKGSVVATCAVWVVQYLCYQSILDDAALNRGGSSSSSSSSSPLAGGVALDLLAWVVVLQFAGILWSPRAYWGLVLIPIGIVWQLYKTIRASLPPSLVPTGATPSAGTAPESTRQTRRGNNNNSSKRR